MYRSSKKNLIRRMGLSSVAVITAVGVGITVAHATTTHSTGTQAVAAKAMTEQADGPDGGVGHFNALEVHGTISALDASSVTLTDPYGTATTYSFTSGLTVTKNHVAATVSDLAVGQRVEAGLTASGSTTISSIDIDNGRSGDQGPDHAMGPVSGGRVSAVSGSTITVTDPRGNTHTITVDGSTTYSFNGVAGNFGEVTVGSFVFATGTSTGTGALTASSVAISTTAPSFGHSHDGDGQGEVGDH
jgi:Domain of unknown function (DUF5666)